MENVRRPHGSEEVGVFGSGRGVYETALVRITPEERKTAITAAKSMGLNVAGVDLLRSSRGPLVMEVNSSPGLEGIENATSKNVAGMIINWTEKNQKPWKTRTKGRG